MREPTIVPAYMALYPGLAEVARRCGYALAIHGSVLRDLDLVAIPWTDGAAAAGELIVAIDRYLRRLYFEVHLSTPREKPHGRIAWLFDLDHGSQLDLSVMPRIIAALT